MLAGGTTASAQADLSLLMNCAACDASEVSETARVTPDVLHNYGIISREELEERQSGVQTNQDSLGQIAPQELAQIDLAVRFAYNSANLDIDGRRQLDAIIDHLRNIALDGRRIVVLGHTDAVGSRAYNLPLSQARADTVAAALRRGLSGMSSIQTQGMAFDVLKIPTDPTAAENRRVQIVLF